MNDSVVIHYASQALLLVLMLSLPVIIATTVVGLLIGLFQALTQIQEQTLPYGFKLMAAIVAILLTARWVGVELHRYTLSLFELIPASAT